MPEVPGYSLGEELGRGGMGVVHAAVEDATGERVAVKLTRPDGPGSTRRRFLREARAARALRHPNIVDVRDFGEHDGVLYLVMDLIEGEDLQRRLDRDGPLPPAGAARLVASVADAAAALHEVGVVHCDVKPANVLLADDGRVLLTDFGVAEPPLDEGAVTGLTDDPAWLATAGTANSTGVRAGSGGTYAYMAPEQWRGERPDARTDVYGLGGLLYAALSGRPPYEQATLPELVYAVVLSDPPRPRPVGVADDALDEVVLRAMSREPGDRFDSAAELAAAVRDGLTGRPPLPVVPVPAEPEPVVARRPRRRVFAALLVLLLAIAGVTTVVWPDSANDGPVLQFLTVCSQAPTTLRDEPGSPTQVAALPHGARVTLLAVNGNGQWYQVLTSDGRLGWGIQQNLHRTSCG